MSTRPSSRTASLPAASREETSVQNPRLLTSDMHILPIVIAVGSASDMNRAEPPQPCARSQSRQGNAGSAQRVAGPQQTIAASDHVFGKSGGFFSQREIVGRAQA